MNMHSLLCKFFILFTLTSLPLAPAYALLPPLWEGVAEIKAILEDKQFGSLLQSGEVLEEIKRTEGGWKIVTNKSVLQVTVKTLPMEHPGPANFSLQFTRSTPS